MNLFATESSETKKVICLIAECLRMCYRIASLCAPREHRLRSEHTWFMLKAGKKGQTLFTQNHTWGEQKILLFCIVYEWPFRASIVTSHCNRLKWFLLQHRKTLFDEVCHISCCNLHLKRVLRKLKKNVCKLSLEVLKKFCKNLNMNEERKGFYANSRIFLVLLFMIEDYFLARRRWRNILQL